MTLATKKIRSAGIVAKGTVLATVDTVMAIAVEMYNYVTSYCKLITLLQRVKATPKLEVQVSLKCRWYPKYCVLSKKAVNSLSVVFNNFSHFFSITSSLYIIFLLS